jgi:hypothetical protein
LPETTALQDIGEEGNCCLKKNSFDLSSPMWFIGNKCIF